MFVECSRANRAEQGPRAVGSTRLVWLSQPRTVLVVTKSNRAPLFHDTLRMLGREKRLVVYVEPAAHAELQSLADLDFLRTWKAGGRAAGGGKAGGGKAGGGGREDGGGGSSSGPAPGGAEQPLQAEGEHHRPPASLMSKIDFIVTLGGDGTVLWVSSLLGDAPVPPMVSFHLGSLGFMTPFPASAVRRTVDAVLGGGFELQLRHRLHCRVVRAPDSTAAALALPAAQGGNEREHAITRDKAVLNEVVVDRGTSPFLTHLECYCDDVFITTVQGDGLIVATPSGSTAYSLAAGGSMVHPQVPGILFTPICPHSLSFRPLVFPDCVTLRIAVPTDARGTMWASFDGKDRLQLAAGDAVLIRMSRWPVPAVCQADATADWLLGAREGLNWNLRKVQGERDADLATLRLD